MTTRFIINPYSAGGATGARRNELAKHITAVFGNEAECVYTERPGHGIELASNAGECTLVVAVGGDGTANEVVNGLAAIHRSSRPTFGVLPAGTGSDLVKSIGMPSSVPAALRVLRDGERRRVDWMRVEFDAGVRYGINVAGFGMAGAVVQAANASGKRWGGRLTFAAATAKVALGWKGPRVEVCWEGPDGAGRWTGPLASTFVGNGAYCGGGMWVGAGGRMDDGLLDMTLIPEQRLLTAVRHVRRLYTGTMCKAPGVRCARIHRLRAKAVDNEEVLLDVDGEQPGRLPLTIEVEPGVLEIAGSWER